MGSVVIAEGAEEDERAAESPEGSEEGERGGPQRGVSWRGPVA